MQRDFRTIRQWGALVLVLLILAACGPESAPPVPTRAPAPTFTPTPDVALQPVDPNAAATAQAIADAQVAAEQAEQVEPAQDAQTDNAEAPAEAPAQEEAPAEPPAETPTPEPPPAAEVVINSNMNVRGGPGTNYNIVGGANQGERYVVTGKSNDGTWWQIDYNGQAGWVFGELASAQNTESVQVAQNIPAPPPTAVPPTPTPVPPPVEQAPPEPPKPQYKFNITAVGNCAPQEAGTWFDGRTYVNGQPANGYRVAFSYAPDGPVVASIRTGPHPGYEGWATGYYSHIIATGGPRAGNWFVWVVDEGGQRISEVANWQSTGPGGGCNQATVDFDSR